MNKETVITTQQTSKKYKATMALGAISICLGFAILFCGGFGIGILSIVIGTALYTFGRFGAWWNHS